jgi:hypothetical protein
MGIWKNAVRMQENKEYFENEMHKKNKEEYEVATVKKFSTIKKNYLKEKIIASPEFTSLSDDDIIDLGIAITSSSKDQAASFTDLLEKTKISINATILESSNTSKFTKSLFSAIAGAFLPDANSKGGIIQNTLLASSLAYGAYGFLGAGLTATSDLIGAAVLLTIPLAVVLGSVSKNVSKTYELIKDITNNDFEKDMFDIAFTEAITEKSAQIKYNNEQSDTPQASI